MESSEKEPDLSPQLAIVQASKVHYDIPKLHVKARYYIHQELHPAISTGVSRFGFKRMEQTFCVESLAVIVCRFVTIQKYHPQGLLAFSIQHLCSLKARKDGPPEYANFCKRIRRSIFLHISNLVVLPIQSMHVLSSSPPQIWDIKEIYKDRKRTKQHDGRLTFLSHYLLYELVGYPQVMGHCESGGIGGFLAPCAQTHKIVCLHQWREFRTAALQRIVS